MPPARAEAALGVILVARCALEGALFAALFAAAQVGLRGEGAEPVVAVALGLTGIGILLASVLRDARAERQNMAIAIGAIGAAAAYGVILRTGHADGLEILSRIVLFGILGEAFVWRNLTLARGLVRWTDARNSGFAAIGMVAAVAIIPGLIDRSGLLIVGLSATGATGVALSLARSTEELALAGRDGRGGTGRTAASGSAVLLAIGSIVAAVFAPGVGDAVARAGAAVAPIVGALLYGVLLLLGNIASLFVDLFRALFALLGGRPIQLQQPPQPRLTPEQDAEALRQLEASRPYVIGAVELIIAVVALLIVVVLVDRMARERRQQLPIGATLDREAMAGDGIGAFLAGLLPRRPQRRRAPRDDGTPATALRILYWRYLEHGERSGVPWRGVGETPAEHAARASQHAARFGAASALVRAFEDLRYGEQDPDAETLAASRTALAAIDAGP